MSEQTYEEYHQQVVAAIREALCARWPPQKDSDRAKLEQAVAFFDKECSYLDEFAEGIDPKEMADDQIDAAT